MFRTDANSDIDKRHLGVGSIVTAGSKGRWLIIASPDTKARFVRLLNLDTFVALYQCVVVKDINYISEVEARELVNTLELNYTFSDFSFDTIGLKL